jgi:D-alanyl-D-alanine carboxypeptidase (penicillin-binding protein 5/6)
MVKKAIDLRTISIKRGFLFFLGLIFFLFPSQNWYSIVQANYQPSPLQETDLELPPVADYPVNFTGIQAPSLTARAAIVIDRDSAVVLLAKNEETQLLPASTVKLMTALVAQESYPLEEVVKVENISQLGQDMKLVKGEMMTVENLLFGVLVSSANDAALLLAQHYPGGKEAFVQKMNQRAQELHLKKTHFADPTGLDVDENENLILNASYTTALDLARLAVEVLQREPLKEMVATKEIIVSDVSGKIKHHLYNINQLLFWLPGMKGVKTGWTEEARECLVGYVERDGRGIITVVLGSQDRFGETVKLVDWVFSNYQWEEVTPSNLLQSPAHN